MEELDLSCVHIWPREVAESCLHGLGQNRSIKKVNFERCFCLNSLDNDGVGHALATTLQNNETLQCLNIESCGMDDGTMANITQAIVHHPMLETLETGGNMHSLPPFMRSLHMNRVLKTLDISLPCHETLYDVEDMLEGLCQLLQANTANDTLYMDYTMVGEDLDGSCIAQALTANESLRTLWLNDCRLSEEDVQVLCNGLRGNQGLQSLSLESPTVYKFDDYPTPLFEMLRDNWTLRRFNIGVGEAGMEALAYGLALNTGLEHLELTPDKAQGEILVHLSRAIVTNQSLKRSS